MYMQVYLWSKENKEFQFSRNKYLSGQDINFRLTGFYNIMQVLDLKCGFEQFEIDRSDILLFLIKQSRLIFLILFQDFIRL